MNIIYDTIHLMRTIGPRRVELFKVQFATDPHSVIVTRTRVLTTGDTMWLFLSYKDRVLLYREEEEKYLGILDSSYHRVLCSKIFVYKTCNLSHTTGFYQYLNAPPEHNSLSYEYFKRLLKQ